MPLRDPRLAIEELHHARQLGAVMVGIFGTVGEMMLHDLYLDPFFTEVERLGMPIGNLEKKQRGFTQFKISPDVTKRGEAV